MFEKLKTFWNAFWVSIKTAYNKAFKHPLPSVTQNWRDVTRINFLDIFVTKLNNLVNTEATMEVESDSTQAERLKYLAKDLESKRYDITAGMLADGDFYVFPATNEKGEIIHTYLAQEQVRILRANGDDIQELEGVIDWHVDKDNKMYLLCRHHSIDDNNTLTVSYRTVNERNESVYLKEWAEYTDTVYTFTNANIGVGRYKSPASSRGLSPIYGVPLNFGCAAIEKTIFNDLKLIEDEFKNGKSVIFTDPRNLVTKKDAAQYELADNVIPITTRAGQNGGHNIDIFNPNIRYNDHYSKLVADLALYEKEVGTSKGILTDNETTESATATAVKRANADTIALIGKIRNAIDMGNEMTLLADGVFLNVSPDLWDYRSDWYDPFEDAAEQWQRLIEAKNNGAAEAADLLKWMFPSLSDDEVNEKLIKIAESGEIDAAAALEQMIGGA